MPLICLITVEMAHPHARPHHWPEQRQAGQELRPEPRTGELRVWKGRSQDRDWDRLILFKQRDGYTLLSHRREFVEDQEIRDSVEHAHE